MDAISPQSERLSGRKIGRPTRVVGDRETNPRAYSASRRKEGDSR